MTQNPTFEEIRNLIFELPLGEQVALFEDLEDRLKALTLIQLAETGFQEWNDPEEDIYNGES